MIPRSAKSPEHKKQMKPLAIYARYSSDKQNDKSVDDQIAECKEFIRKSFAPDIEIRIYEDRAITGAFIHHRIGYQNLLEAVEQNEVSFVIIEDLDRLTRSIGRLDDLYQFCKFRDIQIIPLRSGRAVTLLDVGVKGIINAAYLDNLKHQILRAQKNRAKEGKLVGMAYGYKMKIRDGREVTGERTIDDEKAAVVREIFQLFADNHSIGSIANILNSRGISSPGGKLWRKAYILGTKTRNEGILRNQIYRGKVIWNMKSYRTNPHTGGRNCIMNPENEWVVTQQEDLRILSEELWLKCHVKIKEKDLIKTTVKVKRASTRLINPLRGLVFCGVCSEKKTIANNTRYVCSGYKNTRTCTNARGQKFAEIIRTIFQYFSKEIQSKDEQGWIDEIQQVVDDEKKEKDNVAAEIESINQRIGLFVKIMDDNDAKVDELVLRVKEMNNQRNILKTQLKERKADIGANVKQTISQNLQKLHKNLKKLQTNDLARVQLVILIEKIILTPTEERTGETIKIMLRHNAWLDYYRFLQSQKN